MKTFSPPSHVWCGVCGRNRELHTHKCKGCDHMESGNILDMHRDGWCFDCHPQYGGRRAEMRAGFEAMKERIELQLHVPFVLKDGGDDAKR